MVQKAVNGNMLSVMALVLLGACAVTGGVLSSSGTHAESAGASVTVGSACTMTATVDTAHTAEVSAGTNASDIGATTIKTVCNDSGGFAIYAVGYSNNQYGNNKMIGDNSVEFNTGTATSGANSNWSMKLGQITTGTYATTIDGGFGAYSSVPATFTKVAHRDANTDNPGASSGTGSSISLTYGAYIASTQAPGDYTGKVKFTMVHPASEVPAQPQTTQAGKICYYPNGGDVVGTMGCQTIPTSGATGGVSPTYATLLASNFSREGYGFAGWSKTYDYSDPTGFLGPQEYITFTAGEYSGDNNGLSLYAYWVKSTGNLQGWTGCSALQQGSVTALTDQRDNETYAIAKLADGNCWMIENMRLENTNTDNATGALAQGYNASFAGLADPESASLFDSARTANTLYSVDGSTEKTISGSYQGYRFPRYNNVNTPTTASDRPSNPTSNSTTNSTSNASMYSYGNYYTWAAAIADTTEYSSGDHNTTSICPTGWRIPTGNTSGEFYALNTAVNSGATGITASNGLRAYPNNFVYSGRVSIDSVYHRGSYSFYWSSTTGSRYDAYFLRVYSSGVHPGTQYDSKYIGMTIRCVAPGT